jgi:hypothetical protein
VSPRLQWVCNHRSGRLEPSAGRCPLQASVKGPWYPLKKTHEAAGIPKLGKRETREVLSERHSRGRREVVNLFSSKM